MLFVKSGRFDFWFVIGDFASYVALRKCDCSRPADKCSYECSLDFLFHLGSLNFGIHFSEIAVRSKYMESEWTRRWDQALPLPKINMTHAPKSPLPARSGLHYEATSYLSTSNSHMPVIQNQDYWQISKRFEESVPESCLRVRFAERTLMSTDIYDFHVMR